MEVKATAKNISISPKKLKPLVSAVRGQPVSEALTMLRFVPSPAANEVAKVIKSAASNAENNFQLDPDTLRVVEIHANEGMKLRRFLPMPRGRAGLIQKRHSHITVVVSEKEE